MLMVARLTFAPRAFLQIFITTTLHHRLAGFVGDRFALAWSQLILVVQHAKQLIHVGLHSVLAFLVCRICSTSYAIDSIDHSSNPTETRAVPNQAKNNVTSRVRLDEKYYDRRALFKLANQKPQFARVFGVFLQRDAQLESSFPARKKSPTPRRYR
jgi:hypothetical protein